MARSRASVMILPPIALVRIATRCCEVRTHYLVWWFGATEAVALANDALGSRHAITTMSALSTADELSAPGPSCIDDPEVAAAAVAAAKAMFVIVARLLVRAHARFLRCNSAKLTRPDLAADVVCVPNNTAP